MRKAIVAQHSATNRLSIDTPIGSLNFGVCATKGDLSLAQIVSRKIDPVIPNGMSVEGCNAVLLRCLSPTPLEEIIFSCAWDKLKEAGYGCSGECLDAWEWEHGSTLVIVGTEDDECLGRRIKLEETTPENYPIKMNDNCISIHISEFPENKELTLHYTIAWNSLPEQKDCSCWFAVDVPHKRVLEVCN